MKAMLAVRGNLAANPRFWPERKDEDGHVLQARWAAVVIETRRVRGADGEWRDDPDGGIPVTVTAYGARAMTLDRCDMHCGDPVVAVGEQVATEAYATRDGEPAARMCLTALAVCYDTIMMRRHAEHVAQRSTPLERRDGADGSARGTEGADAS